jgi:hypothetical protein
LIKISGEVFYERFSELNRNVNDVGTRYDDANLKDLQIFKYEKFHQP